MVSKLCPYDPDTLLGQPIGMHHCPICGLMVVPGCGHPQTEAAYYDQGLTPPVRKEYL